MALPKKVVLFAIGAVSLTSARELSGLLPFESHSRPHAPACQAADSAAVISVATRFHTILSTGDTAGINALLDPDLRVLEGGSVENRQEYIAHHLSADIEFAKAVKEERTSFSYRCEGNVAWLVSTSTATGHFRGRAVNSVSAELMILAKREKVWQIRAIHWSSARRQPG